jgi:hypothetical protein
MPFKDAEKRRTYHKKYMRRRRAGVKPGLEALLNPEPITPMKTYVCERYPFYSIGKIRFKLGYYVTDRPEEKALIESNDWFGVHVHLANSDDG